MRETIRGYGMIAIAIAISFGMAACGGAPPSEAGEAGASTMAAEPPTAEPAPEPPAREGGEGEHGDGREGGGEHDGEGREGEGEHGEGHEEGPGEGEEGGEYISVNEGWDRTRNGARLTLVYDPGYEVFMGRVHNTTDATMCAVRVEVHLDSGVELGPTERADVPAGQSIPVELPASGQSFDRWTAHPELSRCSPAYS